MTMTRWQSTLICTLFVLAPFLIRAQSQTPHTDGPDVERLVPKAVVGAREPAVVQLPVDDFGLLLTACDLANSTGVLMSVELGPQDVLSEGVERRRRNRPVVYEGTRLRDALNHIIGAMPQYQWKERSPFVDVRPRGDRISFLDTPVEKFEVNDADVSQALSVLRRIGDPTVEVVPVGTIRRFGDPRQDPQSAEAQSLVAAQENAARKKIAVSLSDVTIRQVLDSILVAHGSGAWVARYVGAEPTWRTVRFMLCTENMRIER